MKIVGHRGAPDRAPENTMTSFECAIADGADAIEFDVHVSSDGDFVVLHDYTVDRTTNGFGLVSALRTEYLDSLDAGSWFAPQFVGERIPALDQVLALTDVEFELEVKLFDAPAVTRLADRVAAAGVLNRVEFTSANSPLLMALKRHLPWARIGVFSPRREPRTSAEIYEGIVTSRAAFAGADVVHVHADDLNTSLCERLHDLGYVVHANDATSAWSVQNAKWVGADRVSTDSPAMAVTAMTPAPAS